MSDDKPRIQWSATEIVGIGIDNPERVRKTEDGKTVLMPTTYRCPLHQKSGEWPDNPCPVCASNALKLDLLPLELDVEAAARSREKTLALLDSIELTPAQQKMAEAVAQYLKRKMTE